MLSSSWRYFHVGRPLQQVSWCWASRGSDITFLSGAASASLALEAAGRGLAVHPMSGFRPDMVRELFGLDESIQPFTALAIGYPVEPGKPDDDFARRDQRPRERKPLTKLIIHGSL